MHAANMCLESSATCPHHLSRDKRHLCKPLLAPALGLWRTKPRTYVVKPVRPILPHERAPRLTHIHFSNAELVPSCPGNPQPVRAPAAVSADQRTRVPRCGYTCAIARERRASRVKERSTFDSARRPFGGASAPPFRRCSSTAHARVPREPRPRARGATGHGAPCEAGCLVRNAREVRGVIAEFMMQLSRGAGGRCEENDERRSSAERVAREGLETA